jgi:DNA-binding SARP family transcriptional activator
VEVRVNLAGTFSIRHGEQYMSYGDMSGVIGRMILTNLSLSLDAIPRDVLIDNLWEENLPATAESVLNATCSRLRRGLANIALPSKDLLISTGGYLQLKWPSHVHIDIRTAVRSIDDAEGSHRRGDIDSALRQATVAYAIVRRPFLPGIEREWIARERLNLAQVMERSLDLLSDLWATQGDTRSSLLMAHQLLKFNPYSEVAIRKVMRSHVAFGDKPAAAKALADWKATLAKDLELFDNRTLADFV